MTKHNKKHYQSKAKDLRKIILTGRVWLEFRDDEMMEQMPAKQMLGDCRARPHYDLPVEASEELYDCIGLRGYFKVDVCDGFRWHPMLLRDVFEDREHHFHKTECPRDRFVWCEERLQSLRGRSVMQSYREHYELTADAPVEVPARPAV